MYSQTDLNEAVTGGAITEDQANSLRSFVANRNGAPTADEEHFRFILGYNDILCFAACLFTLIALGWLGTLIPLGRGGMPGLPLNAPFAPLFIAAASWGLAEIFTKCRHQWLTSILLIIGGTWGVALFLLLLLASSGGLSGAASATLVGALAFLAGGGAAFVHWKRYRQPIAIATMYGFAMLAVIALLATSMGSGEAVMVILLIAGIGAFAYAMWWDGQDPMRHGEKSEAGFWLHWLGAGLIVNALATLFGVNQGIGSIGGAIGLIVIFLVLTVIGLAVNRRAYPLTAISPLIIAIQTLLGEGGSRRSSYDSYGSNPYGSSYGSSYSGSSFDSYSSRASSSVEGTMLSILIIGVILLLLAIYWSSIRKVLVGILPEGVRAKLPPTGTEPKEQAQTFE